MAGSNKVDFHVAATRPDLAWIEIRPRAGTATPFGVESLRELNRTLRRVEELATSGSARLLIISTARPHLRLSGYDLEELSGLESEDAVIAWSREAHTVLDRLEGLPIPSLAAIQGTWLGSAAELALACTYRVASAAATTHLGFPQIRLGVLPAWGGTVRLPRTIGLQHALQLVLTGEPIGARAAREVGLVDRLLPADGFAQGVERYALRRLERGDPHGRRRHRVRRRLFDETRPGRRLLASTAARRYLAEGEADASGAIALEFMSRAADLPDDRAFARESEIAAELILSREAQGRLHAERVTERTRARTPAEASDLDAAAVLGTGWTASDFAHALTAAGIVVRIKDANREKVRQAILRVRERLSWERDQGRLSDAQLRRRTSRLAGVTGFGGFGTLDLLIAAGDDEPDDVGRLLAEAEPHVRDSCLLALVEPAAAPSEAAAALKLPDRLVRIAPALPLDRFPLLEIMPDARTSTEALAAAIRLARRLAMTAVVVRDAAATPGSRLLAVYMAEAARLAEAGATVSEVDAAAEAFGFAVGPFRRADSMGTRRAHGILQAVAGAVGDQARPSPLFQRIAVGGETFFRYRHDRPTAPNAALAGAAEPIGPTAAELWVRRRLVLLLINEGARIVEEEVADAESVDLISLVGLGFPRGRGGLLYHADVLGLPAVVEALAREADEAGERFAPTELLRDLASSGSSFFGMRLRARSGHPKDAVIL